MSTNYVIAKRDWPRRVAGPGRATACDLEREWDRVEAPVISTPQDDENRGRVDCPVLRDHDHVQRDAKSEERVPHTMIMAALRGGHMGWARG